MEDTERADGVIFRLHADNRISDIAKCRYLLETNVRIGFFVDALQKRWEDNGFFGGLKVDEDKILFAVTEQRTKDEADRLVALVEA